MQTEIIYDRVKEYLQKRNGGAVSPTSIRSSSIRDGIC
uniref:Uncharacterized protein n=1 Tax=Arundo donax TaxID=35708 RepID=A0A0A9B500_ARUDO